MVARFNQSEPVEFFDIIVFDEPLVVRFSVNNTQKLSAEISNTQLVTMEIINVDITSTAG
jgi:hypothetical protein